MSVEQNKNIVERAFAEGMTQTGLAIFDTIIAPTYVNHSMPTPGPGPEGLKQVVGMFIQSFPDFRVTLHDVIGEGNKVATRGTWTGTHQGDFMGIPATGKQVAVEFIDLWYLENGKAVE